MIHAPRGVEDILPSKAFWYSWIEKEAGSLFSLYGYQEVRIPTFERTELFLRSVGEETDVGKQMYTFQDKGGRSISLRPEGTAGIARAYIEHKLYGKKKPWKVYYAGPMFRYEKPQTGRLREFYQIGVECFGEKNPLLDVEIIQMAYYFLNKIGLNDIEIQINSIGCKDCRTEYIKQLKFYLKDRIDSLCEVCKRRFEFNPLRILDCKNAVCKNVLEKAPQIEGFLCSSCKEHFDSVKKELDRLKVFYVLNPYLVRGLDYYTRTIFEIKSSHLGSQDTICAGGRYDDLVSELGGPPTPAMGFAIGLERLLLSLEKAGVKPSIACLPCIFVTGIGQACIQEGMRLASLIRSQGIPAIVNFANKSLSAQLRQADKEGFPWVLIVGEKEVEEKRYILRNMKSGRQLYVNEKDFKILDKILKGES